MRMNCSEIGSADSTRWIETSHLASARWMSCFDCGRCFVTRWIHFDSNGPASNHHYSASGFLGRYFDSNLNLTIASCRNSSPGSGMTDRCASHRPGRCCSGGCSLVDCSRNHHFDGCSRSYSNCCCCCSVVLATSYFGWSCFGSSCSGSGANWNCRLIRFGCFRSDSRTDLGMNSLAIVHQTARFHFGWTSSGIANSTESIPMTIGVPIRRPNRSR